MKLAEPMVLDQAEMERIHAQSLRILAAAGVRVQDPECRELLARAGAQVDPDGEKVYLPGRLVEECLALAPAHFRLHRRDGTAIEIGIDTRVFGSLVIDPWIIDY